MGAALVLECDRCEKRAVIAIIDASEDVEDIADKHDWGVLPVETLCPEHWREEWGKHLKMPFDAWPKREKDEEDE